MRSPSPPHKPVAGVLLVAALAAAWFLFAPPGLGGSTTYVFTDGTSMQPSFHTGDLAVVRARSSYRVGDVVAYHNHMLGTVVLHRIVGRDGSRYLMKGDNNDFVDPEHPASNQLIGALWWHVPQASQGLHPFRHPATAGILAALGVLLLCGGAFTERRRRRRRRSDIGAPTRTPVPTSEWIGGLVTVGAAALLPFVALAVVAFHHPAATPVPTPVAYKQSGILAYSAAAAWSAAYPDGRVRTGDPVFLRLVDDLDVRFSYHFSSVAVHRVAGTVSLEARIAATNGWRRTIRLAPLTRFRGDRATAEGRLDLRALPQLLDRLQRATDTSGSYTLTLVPKVRASGTVDGEQTPVRFSPSAAFTLTPQELLSAPATTPTSPWRQSKPGSVSIAKSTPATLSFKVAHLKVSTARTVAERGIVAVICALLGCLLAILLASAQPEDEARGIRARYRRWLIPVARIRRPAAPHLVDVADIDVLARIAERYDRMILHEKAEGADEYSVADDGVVYRYAPGRAPQPAARVTAAAPVGPRSGRSAA